MKRIAIVTYFFPPGDAVGGVRPSALARNLAEMGHAVVVFTRQSRPLEQGFRAVEVGPGAGGRGRQGAEAGAAEWGATTGVKGLARAMLAVPDGKTRWAWHAARALRREAATNGLDAVITLGPPHSTHLVGLLSAGWRRRGDTRWILDMRDLWTDNPYYDYGETRRRIDRRIESFVVTRADAVTATTAGFARTLEQGHGVSATPILTGFDERSAPPARADAGPPLRVVHAGSLYGGRRDPRPLIEAAGGLVHDGTVDPSALRLVFIGSDHEQVTEMAAACGASDVVEVHPAMAHGDVLRHLEHAGALLLVQWRTDLTATEVPGKLFEYLACRMPVIALGAAPEGEVAAILRETGAGCVVNTVSECRQALESLLAGDLRGPDEARLAAFSQRTMAARFERVIVGSEVGSG